jgi:hypothetical protein
MTLVYWNEQVVYGPIRAALPVAFAETAALANQLAAAQGLPHAGVIPRQLGETAILRPSDPKAAFFEAGTRPHVEAGSRGFLYLRGPNRFVAGSVQHPGMSPRPFMHPAAAAFPEIFLRTGRLAFGGL